MTRGGGGERALESATPGKTSRKSGTVIPHKARRPGPRDGRDKTVTGTWTGKRTRTETGTRIGMGARTGARTGTRTERRVEGRESPGTPEPIVEVGRRRERVTYSQSRKNRRTSGAVASCGEPEPVEWRPVAGSGRAEEGRRGARKPRRGRDAMWKTGETWVVGEKT